MRLRTLATIALAVALCGLAAQPAAAKKGGCLGVRLTVHRARAGRRGRRRRCVPLNLGKLLAGGGRPETILAAARELAASLPRRGRAGRARKTVLRLAKAMQSRADRAAPTAPARRASASASIPGVG